PDDLSSLVRLRVRGGAEYWLGLHNFYVITRYNHSNLYAMAVYQLSREILKRRAGSEKRDEKK
ncbi:MAG: lytic murein transglycosylase, partial [Sedimenticola sp.]